MIINNMFTRITWIIFAIILIIIMCAICNIKQIKPIIDIPSFLISLEKDHLRREAIYKQIKPIMYYAVNGNDISRQTLEKQGKIISESKLKSGEIGCFLSHVFMLEQILNKDDIMNTSLILEDDANIKNVSTFSNDLQEVVSSAPEDWEIIFISYNLYKVKPDTKKITCNGITFTPINYLHGAQSYIINKRRLTYEKIQQLFPIDMPVDLKLPLIFKSYVIDPKLIRLHPIFNKKSNTQHLSRF